MKKSNESDITNIQEIPSAENNKNETLQLKEEIEEKSIIIKELKKKIKKIKKNEKDIIIRCKAEIENMLKRNKNEIDKIYKFSLEKIIFELLPVVDNLERTLDILDKKNKKTFDFIKGVELTLKLLTNTLSKFGVTTINEENVNFDPKIHQAMKIIKSENFKSDKVVRIIQKGYLLNKRLIRAAMVEVSKSK
ncbi:MAG: nucleotide exchange factor GrpE [Enterobacteriaceae bacterium]